MRKIIILIQKREFLKEKAYYIKDTTRVFEWKG
jgi:hypothetical protein